MIFLGEKRVQTSVVGGSDGSETFLSGGIPLQETLVSNETLQTACQGQENREEKESIQFGVSRSCRQVRQYEFSNRMNSQSGRSIVPAKLLAAQEMYWETNEVDTNGRDITLGVSIIGKSKQ